METSFSGWISAELSSLGWGNAFDYQPLKVEASFRRFYRILPRNGSLHESLVAMDSPPDRENNSQFTRLARIFANQGVPVPSICAANASLGYFLMTDLGSRHLAEAYFAEDAEASVIAALKTLGNIQTIDDPAVPPYSVERFRNELEIFRQWFVEGLLSLTFPVAQLNDPFDALIEATQNQPQCCVHRDFHCRNLLYAKDGKFGVVDFQDALIGPVSYDLASLLRDCYHEFSEADVARYLAHYLAMTPFELDEGHFTELVDFSAVQRQLKAIGIFSRLHLRDEKSSHLPVITPVLKRLRELTQHYPELHAIANWLGEVQPRAESILAELT